MSDREALQEAVLMLGAIANLAGGYVSKKNRERIQELARHLRDTA